MKEKCIMEEVYIIQMASNGKIIDDGEDEFIGIP